MTYFAFLVRFLVIPIVILGVLTYRDWRRGTELPRSLSLLPPWLVVVALTVIAVIYTTPWDNYLVATGVWRYDPELVMGILLGWVPLEEYVFFVLQSVMVGLWFLFLARRSHAYAPFFAGKYIRIVSSAVVSAIWMVSIVLLVSGWKPGNYLSLELAWALPPIVLQLAVGADILWHYRRVAIPALVSTTLYLCVMDSLAIHSGTWTISPELSLGILLGGLLPVEEAVFFLLTNTLLVFGLVLGLANESLYRLPSGLTTALRSRSRQSAQQMESPNY